MGNNGLRKLARDFDDSSKRAKSEVGKVVSKTALMVKKKWAFDIKARSLAHAKALPYAINYDVLKGDGWAKAEIGYSKERAQGALGNLLEYGSKEKSTEAGKEGENALESEQEAFYKYIDELAEPLR